MREAKNYCSIEGILSEMGLETKSWMKDGKKQEAIAGTIKVLVEQEGKESLDIPVYYFASKFTKSGELSKVYGGLEKAMNELKSIAATGSKETADKVRITGASIRMNEFSKDGTKVISTPRINSSFISKVTREFNPHADWDLEFVVNTIKPVVDKEGVEVSPRELEVSVFVPQYTIKTTGTAYLDLIPLRVKAPKAVEVIEKNWEAGKTYAAHGRINFTTETKELREEYGFGEASVRTVNNSISQLVITAGNAEPLDGEQEFDLADIKAGVATRNARLEAVKQKAMNSTPHSAPAPMGRASKQDLGF